MEKVVCLKLVSGEFVIGYKSEKQEFTDKITLNNLRSIFIQPTPTGLSMGIGPFIIPMAIKTPEEISFPNSGIICEIEEDNISKQMVDGYKSEVSGIVTSANSGIILPN